MNKGVRIKEYALNLSLSAVVMLLPVPGPLGPGSGRASVCVAVPEKNLSGRSLARDFCVAAVSTPLGRLCTRHSNTPFVGVV